MKDVANDHEDDAEYDDGVLLRGPGVHADYRDLYYNSLRILLQILPACRVVHEALFSGRNNPPTLFSAAKNSGHLNIPPPQTQATRPFFYDSYYDDYCDDADNDCEND